MAKSIQRLRKEKGYRSAREFADALGISASSLSRYENQPETIPVKAAWAMADALECSIDEIVGRDFQAAAASPLQQLYDSMEPETRALMDELVEFVAAKDERAKAQKRSDVERRFELMAASYERMFLADAYGSAEFGATVFASPEDERGAFRAFLAKLAADKRRPGIDLHCEGLEEELRDGYADGEGVKQFTEEQIQQWLAEEREQMDAEFGKKDEEVIEKIVEGYDRLHGRDVHGTLISGSSFLGSVLL